MERRIIYTQKRKSLEGFRKELAKREGLINCENWQIDHIIPFSIGGSDEIDNLQLLNHTDHLNKTIKDRKITKILKKEGLCESFGYTQMVLLVSAEQLKKRYLELNYTFN